MIFSKSLAVFLGTIIGVGIFGLPYIASRAGFFIAAIYIFAMALVSIIVHLMYAEICLDTTERHRFPGYVNKYLGANWSIFSSIIVFIGLVGALLCYIIVGGDFLYSLFSDSFGQTSVFYSILFFAFGAYLVFRDIKNISRTEIFLLIALVSILIWLFLKSLPHIEVGNFLGLNSNFIFMPYGVSLFSLWGLSIIPEIKEMISIYPYKKMKANLFKIVFWGITFSSFIYLFFIFIVLGISGLNVSSEAISGLGQILGRSVVEIGSFFGLICCFTSFISVSLTLKKTFYYDYKMPKNISWFISCFSPLFLFLLGARDFIKIIGFTGAIFMGIEGIIMVFLYKRFLIEKKIKKMNPLFYILVIIFIVGISIETIYFLL